MFLEAKGSAGIIGAATARRAKAQASGVKFRRMRRSETLGVASLIDFNHGYLRARLNDPEPKKPIEIDQPSEEEILKGYYWFVKDRKKSQVICETDYFTFKYDPVLTQENTYVQGDIQFKRFRDGTEIGLTPKFFKHVRHAKSKPVNRK
jgi:hypothetical protein